MPKDANPTPPKANPGGDTTTKPDNPSEYLLLNRILDNSSEEECSFLYDVLQYCARKERAMSLQQAMLHEASNYFLLGIMAEEIDTDPGDFRALEQIRIEGGWLHLFLQSIFRHILKKNSEKLLPDDVMIRLADHMTEFERQLDTTREMLKEYPKALSSPRPTLSNTKH